MRKRVSVIVSTILAIACLVTGCNLDTVKKVLPSRGSENLGQEVTRGWESREVVLDGKTIELPMSVLEFQSMGFSLEDIEIKETVSAVKIIDSRLQYPFILNAMVVKPDYRASSLSDCYVVGFSMNRSVAKTFGFKVVPELNLVTEDLATIDEMYLTSCVDTGESLIWESPSYESEWKSGYIRCDYSGNDRYFVAYIADYKSILDGLGVIVVDTGLNVTGNEPISLLELRDNGHIEGLDLTLIAQILNSGYVKYEFPEVTNEDDKINADGILINDKVINLDTLMNDSILSFLTHMSELFIIDEVQYTAGYQKKGTYEVMKTTPSKSLGLDAKYFSQCLENARASEEGYKVVFVFDAGLKSPEWDKLTFTVYINEKTLTPYRGILSLEVFNKDNEVYLVYNDVGKDVRITDEGDKLTSFESKLVYKVTYEEEVIEEKEYVAYGQNGREVVNLSDLSYDKFPNIQLERGTPDIVTGAEEIKAVPDEIIFKDKILEIRDIKELRPVELLEMLNKDFQLQYMYMNNPANHIFPEVNGAKDLTAEYFNAVLMNAVRGDDGTAMISFVFQAGLADPFDLFEVRIYVRPDTKVPDYAYVIVDLHSKANQVFLGYEDENVDIKMFDENITSTSMKLVLKKYY